MKSFSSKIIKLGINLCVDVPSTVLRALQIQSGKEKGPIPVQGTLNGKPFVQTVVRYQGKPRLYINGPMLKATTLRVGDVAKVKIEYDPVSRSIRMYPLLAKALSKNRKAKAAFDQLSPSRKQEILRYLRSMKTEATLIKNVERVISHLCDEPTDRLHALMRKKA
jgi:hypothetical protein